MTAEELHSKPASVHSHSSSSSDFGKSSWDNRSTNESIETVATSPPHQDEPQPQQKQRAGRRRTRGMTVTQKDIPQPPQPQANEDQEEEEEQEEASSVPQEEKEAPNEQLQRSEQEGQEAASIGAPANEVHEDIDWEFWSKVISDFESVAKTERPTLSVHIQRGVPPSLRGMIWQLLANAKDPQLEDRYAHLINQECVYEKAIVRDLPRTFPTHDYFQSQGGQDALFNVVKAYSLYDTDVGYCQSISFIAGPLLLNMPEEEAFCVLVRLMSHYGLRGHFTPQLDLLHQRLYQFDGLLGDHLPHVHRHFETQGIRSNMYASQWFMTLFAYKFPLHFVFRIYDILLADGIEALYTFGLALLQRNQATLLSLEFDSLVNYLKHDMLDVYEDNVAELIRDAYLIKIPQKRFHKLAKEYRVEAAKANSEAEAIEALRKQNKTLTETVKSLENNLTLLNKEHAQVANELIESKMEVARVNDENDALRQQSHDLKKALETLPGEIEAQVKEEMEILVTKNAALVQRNSALEDQMAYMENMVADMKVKFSDSENDRETLRQRLAELKNLCD